MDYSSLSLPPNGSAVSVASMVAFTEGPAVDAEGNVYFSDIINNRILVRDSQGNQSVFRHPSHRTNGQTFDPQGRLYHCEGAEFGPGGGRRVTRTNLKTVSYTHLTLPTIYSV